MSLRQRVVHGVLWSAGLSLTTQAATFAMGFLLARVLGKQTFGEWGIVLNTIGAIAAVAQLSMSVTATKYLAEHRHADPARVGSILGLCSFVTLVTGGLASVGLLVAAPYVADQVLHAPHLTLAVQVSVGYLFFVTINGYQVGALTGLEAFQRLAAIGAVYGVASTAVVVLAGYLFGLQGALVAMSCAAAANWGFHHLHLTRYCASHGIEVHYRDLRRELPVLTGFTLPATLSGLAGSAGIWLSNVVLVRAERGYEEMALLAAAASFRAMILFGPSVVSRVSVPLLVNLFGNKDHARYREAYAKNLWVLIGSAVAVALPIAVLARYLLIAFGRSYTEEGAPVVGILALSAVFEVAVLALYQQIFSSGWMWWGLSIAVLRSGVLVACAYALVPELGARGVAWANAAGYGASLVLTFAIVRLKMPAVLRPVTPG